MRSSIDAIKLFTLAPLATNIAFAQSTGDDSAELSEYLRRYRISETAPMDSLGGVTIGSRITREGYTCTSPQECTKPARIAGEDGSLTVILCDGRVSEVAFDIWFMDITWVQQLGAGTQEMPSGARLSVSVETDTERTYYQLSSSLSAAGWICRGGEPTTSQNGPIRSVNQSSVCYSPDGRKRRFGTSLNQVAQMDTAYGTTRPGQFTMIRLSTHRQTVCTEGL